MNPAVQNLPRPPSALRSLALALLATGTLTTAPAASASPPSDVADLVGARGSSGEQEMQSRGYAYVTMTQGTQYWWNAGRGSCVGIRVANGRYQSVDAVSASRCGQQAAAAGQKAEIKDLIGGDAVKAFDIMTSRGFTSVDTYNSSDDYLVTWWYNASTGQCVNTQSKNGRVTSAAEDGHPKCNEAAAKAGGGGTSSAGGTSDSFDTVCGVIVGGKDSPYRCRVTDQYAGGQKTRTMLRFPDQTVELTWRPSSRVGLQFEGMVPKEARYASSEGETNWVFEGKTYYYFSDKDRARSEVQRLRN
jgi:hypothetical protein